MKKVISAVTALTISLSAYYFLKSPSPPARQVFLNANILTLDANNTVASAVAVEGDRIVAVGDRDDVIQYLDGAEVHDLQGKTLLPGFIDAHGHFPGMGLSEVWVDLNSPPIGHNHSIAEMLASLKAWGEKKGGNGWLAGFGYDDSLMAEHRHPTRDELDSISTSRPIVVTHVSGHTVVANSKALELAGIDENTPNPEGGVIGKDPVTGRLTGLLEEEARVKLMQLAMDFSLPDVYRMFSAAVRLYAANGITTAQSGGVDLPLLKGLRLASQSNIIPFRLEVWPLWQLMGEDILSGKLDLAPFNTDKMRTKVIKIVADGSIQAFTGYLSRHYYIPFKGRADYRGYPAFSRERLTDIITRAHQAGYQLAIHGNGDGAIDDIIYAFDQAQKAHPVADPRLILVHAQMARDDQLDDFKRLGITPSFFTAHTFYWGDRHKNTFIGPERAAHISPTHSALERNLRFSVHLDSPVVPMDTMQMLWSTVNRISTSGDVIGADQRVSVMQALRAMTIDAAWQIFQEKDRGSIEPGKLADLVVLSGNPLDDPKGIRNLKVTRTLVGGVPIYKL